MIQRPLARKRGSDVICSILAHALWDVDLAWESAQTGHISVFIYICHKAQLLGMSFPFEYDSIFYDYALRKKL